MLSFRAMIRLVIIGAALALCSVTAAWAQAAETAAMGQRGLTYELGPKLPHPEKEAHADPRFAAAARYTIARQVSAVAAALLIIAALAALYFSGAGARLARAGGDRPVAATLAVSGAVGAAVAVPFLLAYVARAVFLSGAGGELLVGAVVIKPLCYGLAAGALAFAVGATRPLWPRTWWIAATFACVAAAVCWAYLRPLPPAEEPSSPAGGFLLERAQYLSAQYQIPPVKISVDKRPPADELVAAAVPPGRGTVVVSAGAESLSRYEAEVFLAGAVTRGEAERKSFLGPAALVFFMASLIVADALARALARRRGADDAEPAGLLPFAAVLVALWSAALVAYNGWSRGLRLAADEEVVRLTRKPIAAVTLYYEEARANLDAAEPNPVLHFLADAKPSPAERAARARRLRLELAAGE
jgi:Zn-dependent protease with chaperone function